MKVSINNTEHEFQELSKLTNMLKDLGYNSLKGIAIAVNNVVIPKTNWEKHSLTESDKITIIKATQGG